MALHLPYETFTLESPMSQAEALAALTANIKPQTRALTLESLKDDSYHGAIKGNHFIMERALSVGIGLQQLFFPVAKGYVNAAGTGSQIEVHMRLKSVMESVLAATIVMGVAMSLVVSLFSGLLIALLLVMLLLGTAAFGFYVYFLPEVETTQIFLASLLKVRE